MTVQLPDDIVRRIADALRDSTSRVRMAAAFGDRKLIRSHDTRLSLLEFIVRQTGTLRLKNLETLRFLRQHGSPLVSIYDDTDLGTYADLLDAIETGRALTTPCEEHVQFGVNWTVTLAIAKFATPAWFDAWPSSRDFVTKNLSGFLHYMDENPALRDHVSRMEWFKDAVNGVRSVFESVLDMYGGSRSKWLDLLDETASSRYGSDMLSARRLYGKMPRTEA